MKYLILFAVLFLACQPSEYLEESICIDRCLRIEGTILNSLTNEPYKDLPLKLQYNGAIFSNLGVFTKARIQTDANGFYSTTVEVLDAEIDGRGNYELVIDNNDEVYWINEKIVAFDLRSSQVDSDNTYTVDFSFHSPAYIKYDLDGLSKLEEGGVVYIKLQYEIETVFGSIYSGNSIMIPYAEKEDRGEIKVAAGASVRITVTQYGLNGYKKVLKEIPKIKLEYNEVYELEVEL